MQEFLNTTRLADLFTVATSKSYTVKVLSKQTVTVEVMHIKSSLYDNPDGFISKNFDVLCNLLKNFEEYDESLKISALKVLLQASEKMAVLLTTYLEDNEFDTEDLFMKRNSLKKAVFLLCHFTNAFDKDLSRKIMAANIAKGKKKKISLDSEYSEWPELRVKFVVIIKKIFKLPINKLWDPPFVDPEFVNFVTVTFFKLLENVEVAKDKGMRTEIFRFLGTVLKEYRTGLVYSVKIIQLVQDFEHLPSTLADGVIYFVKECAADTLISDILREATLLDMDVLTQNLTAAHSLSQFLTSVCEVHPDRFLPHVSLIIQFLEWESHVIRNCALSVLGMLLSKALCSENLSEKEKSMREELLEHVQAHLLDGNSFVRCRAIQVLKMLMEEKALASFELYKIGKLITKRLKDKASNVRKNAMSFMSEFVNVNQFVCQVPLATLKESYQNEVEKLKEMKEAIPVIFDAFEEESEEPKKKTNAVIFDDSDDEFVIGQEITSNEVPQTTSDQDAKDDLEMVNVDDTEDKAEKEVQEKDIRNEMESDSQYEAFKKQQNLVNYLKNTMNFSEVIHNIMEPIQALLHSSTQTDILEAIEFIIAIANNSVKGAELGVKQVLKLVWSKEAVIREAALNAFKNLYLLNAQNECDPTDIAKNLIELLDGSCNDDAICIEECVKYFSQSGNIPKAVSNVLWSMFSISKSELSVQDKVSVLQLLGMLTQINPETILMRLDNFIDVCLEKPAEKSFLLVMYALNVLGKANHKNRGKISIDSVSCDEVHLPHSHLLVSCLKNLLINGIKTYEDDQWIPMANEAVSTIFSLIEEPVVLCTDVSTKLANILIGEMQLEKPDEINADHVALQNVPHVLLSRFLAFCGFIAIHYNNFLKVDVFARLRREEAKREKRRRRSSVHSHVSAFQSTSFISPRLKSAKKRKSFHKLYKLMPPVDEETTYEQIIEMCARDTQSEDKLVGILLPFVISSCCWTLKTFNKDVQAAASLSLSKFMLLSEQVCQENMQLFATIAERSPEAYIRGNMIIAMGDLTTTYPNIVEPWTQQIFQRLNDSDSLVRQNSVIILTHLILHDFVRIKGLISDAAKCIADTNPAISTVAKYLFAELSKKGNVIYNIIPDIISSLSDQKSGIGEEAFQTVMRYILQYIEKEKLVEGLVEKLCCRFTDSSTEVQIHELTFCLSILTLNDKCYSKLMEFKSLLKERMSDPVVMRYITNITANAKKNDAKTAAELEAFRNELGI